MGLEIGSVYFVYVPIESKRIFGLLLLCEEINICGVQRLFVQKSWRSPIAIGIWPAEPILVRKAGLNSLIKFKVQKWPIWKNDTSS